MKAGLALGVVTLAAAVLGCDKDSAPVGKVTPEKPTSFTEVKIESRPGGWGYAHKTVSADGRVRGGHMSGGAEAPRVFESQESMGAADVEKLKELVTKVKGEPNSKPLSDTGADGTRSVIVSYADGTSTTHITGGKQKFSSANIQAIFDLVHKYRAGAW